MEQISSMRVTVIVATRGRPREVADLLRMLERQTLAPSSVVLSVESDADVPAELPAAVAVIKGPAGLTAQRNRGLELVAHQSDVIVFYDDDYVPAADALAQVAAVFAAHSDVMAASGRVLADGVMRGGIGFAEAFSIVQAYEAQLFAPERDLLPREGVYGCNMAFRASVLGACRFDENLPAYAWQEDTDFAGQVARLGRIVTAARFVGVHRGVTGARSRGVPLGFSQMVNPIYLARKGTVRYRTALAQMARNFMANHVKALRPEPYIDRAGRVRGNWLGIWAILQGRADPQGIRSLMRVPAPAGGTIGTARAAK